MKKWYWAAGAALAVVGGLLPFAATAQASTDPGPLGPDAALAARVPARAADQGTAAATTPATLEVVLAPSDPGGIRALLADLYNPSSANYHHWLTPKEFDSRFGPSSTAVAQTEAWLRSRGLDPKRTSTYALTATADVGHVAAATGTVFHRYRTSAGATGMVAEGDPLVPANLRPEVQALMGLSTLPAFHQKSRMATRPARAVAQPAITSPSACAAASTAAGTSAITLNQLTSAYGIGSLLADNFDGSNQTVAVYELAEYSSSDVSAYKSCFGLSNSVSRTKVDGGAPLDYSGGTAEADLDIEQIATQAPGSTIHEYDAPNTTQAAYDLWNTLISSATGPKVISTSWGLCEASGGDPYTTLFAQAATQGQSIFAAAGDSGSEDCGGSNTSLNVDYPAADPNVTAVGGTTLDVSTNGETTWNGANGAGGGGESMYETAPSWQPSVSDSSAAAYQCSPSCREVPDLSANSGEPMIVYATVNNSLGVATPGWYGFEGTSFAAPMMAGLVADRNQGCAAPTGNLAPAVYGLAASSSQYPAALRDITTGNNDYLGAHGGQFAAGTGYDLATGLGTPVAQGLTCPEVESLSETTGLAADQVTITGLGLEGATFYFGSAAASVVSQTATSATVVAPAGSGTVTVQAKLGTEAGTATQSFTYSSSGGGSTTSSTSSSTSSTSTTSTTLAGGGGGGGGGGGTVTTTTTTTTTTVPVTTPPPVTTTTAPKPACATAAGTALPSAAGIAAVDIAGCDGYFVVSPAGRVAAFGAASWHGDLGRYTLASPIIAIVATPDGNGYWLLGQDGGVFNFGDAHFFGSTGGVHLNAPVVGMAVTPDNRGYWIVAKDGGVFTFGDARFYGSTGNLRLAAPVDGIAVAPGGHGYWLVASDGGVFTFTNDGFYGSLGGLHLAKPIVGMSSTPDGRGYTLVGSDGGVFSFGDAPFYGSLGGHPPATSVVDLSPAPGNDGYYLVTSGGAVYAFGPGARYFGSI